MFKHAFASLAGAVSYGRSIILLAVTLSVPTIAKATQEPPRCNDSEIKANLLRKHFSKPKEQILSSIIANLLIAPDDQDPNLWRENWQTNVANVRQERFDTENNIRYCEADMITEGGPLLGQRDPSAYAKMAPLCVNHIIEYRIQITEDNSSPYVTSQCTSKNVSP